LIHFYKSFRNLVQLLLCKVKGNWHSEVHILSDGKENDERRNGC